MTDSDSDGSIKCIVKKAISLRVGNPSVEFKSGCSVIDVIFPAAKVVTIGCISFVNNYTASMSIKYKTSDDTWKTCLKNFVLMPSPHCEEGSQKMFSVKADQMLCSIKDAVLVRLVLRQPSPHWLNFSLDNLTFSPPTKISSHLTEILSSNMDSENFDDEEDENRRVVDIASKLQQLWALTEATAANEGKDEESHFDIDGCYDLNLLSYT
ncbi:nicolin-1-like [Dendronephthya gigantea]|uniref:nicolin-1-like n=1 Tax=Dendronephthya gigantea TaxID=151771 RepID=UPI001068D713|nr:nicolin-1-like [Dendronephthya gigantea]